MDYNIHSNRDYLKLNRCLGENPRSVLVRNICDNAKKYFVSIFNKKKKLVVLPSERSAILFYEDYKFYDKNVYYFGEKDLLFSGVSVVDEKLEKERINILKALGDEKEITVVTTIQACLEKLPHINEIINKIIKLKVNTQINFSNFINKLINIGYKRVAEVDGPSEFSVHGGIIDIYDVGNINPIRIEFIDNLIENMRYFNIETRRSIDNVDYIEILPSTINFENNEEIKKEESFILDYFKNDYVVFMDEPKRILERLELVNTMLSDSRDLLTLNVFDRFDVLNKLTDKNCVQLTSIDDRPYVNESKYKNIKNSWDYDFDFMMTEPIFNKKDFSKSKEEIKKYLSNDFTGFIVINSHTRADRFRYEFVNNGINADIYEDISVLPKKGNVGIIVAELSSGFIDSENKFFIFTEKDLFGIEPERKRRMIKKTSREGYTPIFDLTELKLGDYVIHDQYGVGVFRGLQRLKSDETEKDYVKIEYRDGGFLYVLATKLESLERFASKSAHVPKLNKLGSNDFIKLKRKVKEDILKTAKDLIDLYARRQEAKGFKYSQDSLWQREFEETFPYIETYDQLLAIEAVKNDMESDKTMDRLICGDVGFGKTEVAIRATFKATQDGKQVAYLVPTTVLCMQHYRTFTERFKEYPIKVEYLSRFKTKKENEMVVKGVKEGEIDVVIGTHRLLSGDVEFKNLGLLIIDEEQRFGVSHKEQIKKIRNNVDALTLSATPIPRTLYMSLSGIRDMSMLSEAPPERMPIRTYVLEYNEELIREAVNRELKRDGQVFIVHNKVLDIYAFADNIAKLCPYAKIAVAHGKLREDELSKVMMDFIDKKYNVLVTTTIIETGLDIQNANTLIIDNAEKFGLSQLYQLRGRVGRSNRTAYAFFMYGKNLKLTEDEFSRLKAIKDNTTLGSGLKIAMKDLEMRGAGNLLGHSQSGHIDIVGYDMYIKLLNEAVKYINDNKDNEENVEEFVNSYDTIVDIDIAAFIPNIYISEEEVKLDVYRKISKCVSEKEFDDLKLELKDRFGDYPKELENLIFIAKLKIKAHKFYVTDLNIKRKLVSITFAENHKLDGNVVMDIINKFCGTIRVINGAKVTLVYRAKDEDTPTVEKNLKIAKYIIDNLKLIEKNK